MQTDLQLMEEDLDCAVEILPTGSVPSSVGGGRAALLLHRRRLAVLRPNTTKYKMFSTVSLRMRRLPLSI
jgi:hypothetical protein